MRRLAKMFLVMATALCTAPAAVARPVSVGYVPTFRGIEVATASSDLGLYTHLNLAFVNPDKAGNILAGQNFACSENGRQGMLGVAQVRALASKAQRAGSKLLISLGGGVIPGCAGAWDELLKPQKRARIVANLLAAADKLGLDGIDVDIEGALLTKIDREGNFVPFVEALSKGLKARGKLLTCATASYEGGMVPQGSIPFFDLVGIMSYDAIGPSWGAAGSEHAPVEQARKDLQLWLDRGVPRERLVLGLPFYGYGYGRYKANYSFRDVHAQYGEAALLTDVIGSRCAGCSYITYNGLPTLLEKAKLAKAQGAGIMVWEISQDSPDQRLIRAINKELAGAAE